MKKRDDALQYLNSLDIALKQCSIEAWLVDIPNKTASHLTQEGEKESFSLDFDRPEIMELWGLNTGKVHPDDQNIVLEGVRRMWSGAKQGRFQARQWNAKHNNYSWYEYVFDVIESKDGKPITAIGSKRDITAEKNEEATYKEMAFLSTHDLLTGLLNRNSIMMKSNELLKVNPEETFVFAKIDIDNFKLYNSFYGDKEGDRLLRFVAQLIENMAKKYENCIYGRLQGDIFCILAPYKNDGFKADIIKANQKLHDYRYDYNLRLSMGTCIINKGVHTIEEAINKATIASKICKDDINLDVVMYDEKYESLQQKELFVVNNMQQALEREEFKVYFQPKYALEGDVPSGAEALVRWIHPEKGLLSPIEFIPIFEQNGFIASLDMYMWEKTCALVHKWKKQGYRPKPISVNLSRVSMYNPNIVEKLRDILDTYGLTTKEIHLEVTESAYMSNPVLMRKIMHNFHKDGFVIMMDDFGSGYSSLNTLKDFHINVLKIDMKFLPQNNEVKRAEIILASIIRMAKWLGIDVIMEGVETQNQKDFLNGINCDYIQGYYYAKPMPAEEYAEKYVYTRYVATTAPIDRLVKGPSMRDEILIIEDSEISLKSMLKLLGNNYKSKTFVNAEDCILYLKDNYSKVGLVIVDNVLPGMYGVDFLEYCKTDNLLKLIPKIMITADTSAECYAKALNAGIDAFLPKPFDAENFKVSVKRCMEKSNSFTIDALKHTLNYLGVPAIIFRYSGERAYFEFANDAMLDMFDIDEKMLSGNCDEDIMEKHVHPDDLPMVHEMYEILKKEGTCKATYRSVNGKHKWFWVTVRCRIIQDWNGKSVCYVYDDITEHKRLLDREHNLTTCYEILTKTPDFDEGLEKVMDVILKYYEAERVYVFNFDWEKGTTSNTKERVAQGVSREIDNLQNLPISLLGYWLPFFQVNQPVFIDSVEALKDIPERRSEYNVLAAQHIRRLMVVPITYNDNVYGYMGVDNPTRHKDDKDLLRNLAYFISHEFYDSLLRNKIAAQKES